MSNTPTDAELKKLAEECGIGWGAGLGGMDDFLRAFACAVLAKWGTPQPAPSDPDDHPILAITTAYEQGVGKGRQAYSSGKEIANPYGPGYRCDLAWQYGYKEGKKQAAPAPSVTAPAGWRVVPENATDAMVFAGCTVDNATHMKIENSILKTKVWAAMIDAAPTPPAQAADRMLEDAARLLESQHTWLTNIAAANLVRSLAARARLGEKT